MLIDLNITIETQEAQLPPGGALPGEWFFGVYEDEEFSTSISTYTEEENFKWVTMDLQPGGTYYFLGARLDVNEERLGPEVSTAFTIPESATESTIRKFVSDAANKVIERLR
jgi:hypothetical protein